MAFAWIIILLMFPFLYCYIAAEGRNNITCVYRDKLLHSKHQDGFGYERERETENCYHDTMLRRTYSELCFYDGRFDTKPVLNRRGPDPIPTDLSSRWLLSESLTATPCARNTSALNIFWRPTHFSSSQFT